MPRQLVAASGNPRARELLSQARCVLREGQHRAHNLRCDGVEALVQVIEPSPHLFIFGAGSDAVPVVDLAKLLGWKVSVCTRSNRPTIRDRFAGKARLLELPGANAVALAETCARPLALVMAHDYETDRENLDALLATSIPYIGVLGPAERTDRMVAELRLRGRYLSDADLERVHGPAGLRLGAETPSEIALSILSEAQALIARTQVVALRDCVESIHAPPMQRLRATYAERS